MVSNQSLIGLLCGLFLVGGSVLSKGEDGKKTSNTSLESMDLSPGPKVIPNTQEFGAGAVVYYGVSDWERSRILKFISNKNTPTGANQMISPRGKRGKLNFLENIKGIVGYGASVKASTSPFGIYYSIIKDNYFPLDNPPREKIFRDSLKHPKLTGYDRAEIENFLGDDSYKQGDRLKIIKEGKEYLHHLKGSTVKKSDLMDDKKIRDYDFILKPSLDRVVNERGFVEVYIQNNGEEKPFSVYDIFKK
ncbi:hypothetical protein ACFLZZ_03925 [Nanoarchaeota archaeon]